MLQRVSYIKLQVDCVLLYELITTTSLIHTPIILSILQRVSYIEVQVDLVLHYE